MTNEEVTALSTLIGSIRGAQLVASREGVRPQMTLDVITGVNNEGVEITHIIVDAPTKNAIGEDINIFASNGISRPAYPGEIFATADGGKLKIRRAEAPARFLVDGKWGEAYAPAATKAAVKLTVSHRVDIDALKAVSRNARRKDGDSWVDIPTRAVTANLPIGDTRITVEGVKRYVRLTEGGTIRLLPLPAEAVSSQRASAAHACELD